MQNILGQTIIEISRILSFASHHCVRYIERFLIYRTQWWDAKLKILDISATVSPGTLLKKEKMIKIEFWRGWRFQKSSES